MPQLHREGPYTFFCYSNERQEPPHVHVRGPKYPHAKFWLDVPVSLADPGGYNSRELRAIREIILAHRQQILNGWYEHARKKHPPPEP
jgi:hypothetical protein